MTRRLLSTLFILLVSGFLTAPATACTVCYGAADNPMIDGGQNAILFMLLLTYLLLGGGAFMMVVVRRRTALSTRGK
jgi:hypothetical protein